MLFRKIESKIRNYFTSNTKEIMLIEGARQIGKSYIIRHVGKSMFENYIEINFEKDKQGDRLRFISNKDYNVKRAFVLSNNREVTKKEGITYLPIYFIMFFKKNDETVSLISALDVDFK
ncbi:AAA family ATPase [uncultured Bacteroides sp.]|jgi:hypothetical protein|uniref:AAA family ATPase n=1 Tax=uncultured Bacteroides sp. TaxID=162156 RepID=UPI002596219E|nr:AAA family ATPase [uncultured Bacteroides sp.]